MYRFHSFLLTTAPWLLLTCLSSCAELKPAEKVEFDLQPTLEAMANATADVTAQAVIAAMVDQRRADATVKDNSGEIHQGDTWFEFGDVDGALALLFYIAIVRPVRQRFNGKS